NFSADLQASQLGSVAAVTADQWGQIAQAASVTLANVAPVIQSFTGTLLGGGLWKFTGKVVDEAAAGLTVVFSGIASVSGRTTTVEADGTFSLVVQLAPGETGAVLAKVTDMWNIDSEQASFYV